MERQTGSTQRSSAAITSASGTSSRAVQHPEQHGMAWLCAGFAMTSLFANRQFRSASVGNFGFVENVLRYFSCVLVGEIGLVLIAVPADELALRKIT